MGQRFQIVATLDQYANFRGTANAAEEAKGNRNYKRTWTGNNKEC